MTASSRHFTMTIMQRVKIGFVPFLKKITSTTLTKSALVNIIGLISNLEKKGICHMLVNDERIRSWVVIDDETV